jgi:hypothetical protein
MSAPTPGPGVRVHSPGPVGADQNVLMVTVPL